MRATSRIQPRRLLASPMCWACEIVFLRQANRHLHLAGAAQRSALAPPATRSSNEHNKQSYAAKTLCPPVSQRTYAFPLSSSSLPPSSILALRPRINNVRFMSSRFTAPKSEPRRSGQIRAAAETHQLQTVAAATDLLKAIETAKQELLQPSETSPTEDAVLAWLAQCRHTAHLIMTSGGSSPSPPAAITTAKKPDADSAAATLLSLEKDRPLAVPSSAAVTTMASPLPPPQAVQDRKASVKLLSETTLLVLEHPAITLTPRVLDLYVEIQSLLAQPESLPYALQLYATKPRLVPSRRIGSLFPRSVSQNPNAAAKAIEIDTVEKALAAAMEAKNLDAAIGIIENSYATKAFARAKLLKKGMLPLVGFLAVPPIGFVLAQQASILQNSFDQRTATMIAFVGMMTYVGVTASMGFVAVTTQNDQVNRVSWMPGMPLRERWLREEERAALDKVASSFGFSENSRFGEEDGREFQALREFIMQKGMLLDAVELMEGMN